MSDENDLELRRIDVDMLLHRHEIVVVHPRMVNYGALKSAPDVIHEIPLFMRSRSSGELRPYMTRCNQPAQSNQLAAVYTCDAAALLNCLQCLVDPSKQPLDDITGSVDESDSDNENT